MLRRFSILTQDYVRSSRLRVLVMAYLDVYGKYAILGTAASIRFRRYSIKAIVNRMVQAVRWLDGDALDAFDAYGLNRPGPDAHPLVQMAWQRAISTLDQRFNELSQTPSRRAIKARRLSDTPPVESR